jgi:hypothetical protein
MSIRVAIFRGQGVKIQGRGYGVVHRFVSPEEVLVKLRDGFTTVQVADLFPVAALDQVAKRYEEYDIDLELSARPVGRDQLEPDVSDEEAEVAEASQEVSYEEFSAEADEELVEEMES